MPTSFVETGYTPLELPPEALTRLNEDEATGLRFLANHPNFNILIHFSEHGKAEDLGDEDYFEVPLAKADLYAHENLGYERAENQYVLDIFSRRLIPRELLGQVLESGGDSFNDRKLTAIYDTGTYAVAADVTSDHWLVNQEPSIQHLGYMLEAIYTGGMPGTSESIAGALINIVADRQKVREWIILSDLGNKIAELATVDPTIADKLQGGILNVFMTYGSAHTGLFHKLRQLGLRPKRTFPTMPYEYSPVVSAIRKKIFEKI